MQIDYERLFGIITPLNVLRRYGADGEGGESGGDVGVPLPHSRARRLSAIYFYEF